MPSKLLVGDLTTGSLLTPGDQAGVFLDTSGWVWDKNLLTSKLKELLVWPLDDIFEYLNI